MYSFLIKTKYKKNVFIFNLYLYELMYNNLEIWKRGTTYNIWGEACTRLYHNQTPSLKCCIFFALLRIGFFNKKHRARLSDKTFACQRWLPSGARSGSWGFGSGTGTGTGTGSGTLRRGLKTQCVCLGNLSRLSVSACCSCCALVRRFGVRVAFHVYINKSQRFSRLTYCNLCLVTALYRRKTNFNHLLFSINEMPPLGLTCGWVELICYFAIG